MALVKFLRGKQADLPASKVDGRIYIATDERAMYVDYAKTEGGTTTVDRLRIGDFREYANMTAIRALDRTNLSTTALYYAVQENILAKWDGTSWVQINAQKSITSLITSITEAVSVSNNDTATISMQFRTNGVSPWGTDPSHVLHSADATWLRLSASGTTLTLTPRKTNTQTDLSVAANGTITIADMEVGTAPDGTAVSSQLKSSTIRLLSGTGVTVTGDATNKTITITADNSLKQSFGADGKLTTTLVTNTIDKSTVSVTPKVKLYSYDTNGDAVVTEKAILPGASTATDMLFYNGTLQLPVYTTAQTDALIEKQLRGVNAMTFKGTVGTAATGISPTVTSLPIAGSQVKIGDTYKVVTQRTYYTTSSTTSGAQAARVGDMFIATSTDGTEDANGYIEASKIKWEYIPSGDDDVQTFKMDATNTVIKLVDKNSMQTGPSITIGTGLTGSLSANTNSGTLTISHSTITTTNTTDTEVKVGTSQDTNSTGSLTAITGLTISNGHITAYKTGKITITDTNLTKITQKASVTNNEATLTAVGTRPNGMDIAAVGLKVKSSTINFSMSSSDLVADIEWEDF